MKFLLVSLLLFRVNCWLGFGNQVIPGRKKKPFLMNLYEVYHARDKHVFFQQDEEEVLMATRLAVHSPQAPLLDQGQTVPLTTDLAGPIRLPSGSHRANNDPRGPVNLLGPLSIAGPFNGFFTGTRWKPSPEVRYYT